MLLAKEMWMIERKAQPVKSMLTLGSIEVLENWMRVL